MAYFYSRTGIRHDAINVDALSLVIAMSRDDEESKKSSRESLKEHIKKMKESYDQSKSIESNEEIKTVLKTSEGALTNYIKLAEDISTLSQQSSPQSAEKASSLYKK